MSMNIYDEMGESAMDMSQSEDPNLGADFGTQGQLSLMSPPQGSPFRNEQQVIERPADEFFDVAPTDIQEDDPRLKPFQEAWFESFARKYHERKFKDLADYVTFADNIKDQFGNDIAHSEIMPYVQKKALEYMPSEVRREYEARKMEKDATNKGMAQLKVDMQLAAEGLKMGLQRTSTGWVPAAKNPQVEQLKSVTESYEKRLASLDNQIDNIIKAQDNMMLGKNVDPNLKASYDKQLAILQGEYFRMSNQYMKSIRNMESYGKEKVSSPGVFSYGQVIDTPEGQYRFIGRTREDVDDPKMWEKIQ